MGDCVSKLLGLNIAAFVKAAEDYYIFTGREAVHRHGSRVRIDESLSVIRARAFEGLPNIKELDYCHIGVKNVE